MEESLTQGDAANAASNIEPTVVASTEPTADGNQETISTPSNEGSEAVSTTTADNNTSGGDDNDVLAKFAKGQGYTDEDIAGMTEREKKTLLSLKKNVDNFRNQPSKIANEVSTTVDAPREGETDSEFAAREIRQFRYEKYVDKFWQDESKDSSLEPIMGNILREKQAELTPILGEEKAKEYCFALSRDLNTLYAQAQMIKGNNTPEAAIQEARREERDSIKKQLNAAPDAAHAVQGAPKSQPKVTLEWIRNEYDSKNPEHVALVDAFYGKK